MTVYTNVGDDAVSLYQCECRCLQSTSTWEQMLTAYTIMDTNAANLYQCGMQMLTVYIQIGLQMLIIHTNVGADVASHLDGIVYN